MKTTKNEKRYVPKQIATLIQESDYKRKDDLFVIIDMIYRRQIYYKSELQKIYGFIEIPRSSFQKLIAKQENISLGIEFLIDKGIILRNEYCVWGAKAKGYKIKTELLGSEIEVEITDKNINTRIKKTKLENRKKRVKNLEFAKSKYYKTFNLDVNAALEAAKQKAIEEIRTICQLIKYNITTQQIDDMLECKGDYVKTRTMIAVQENGKQLHNVIHRLMIHQQQIHAIGDGFLYFKRNTTNGRLDSNLTSLPSYLRKFIKSDEKLYNLDIKNSQPYFLYTKLINEPLIDKDELEVYGRLVVEGRLYEFLMDAYNSKTEGKSKTREQIKRNIFKIYYSKVTSYQSEKAFFRSVFPSIMDYIDRTNCEVHNTLAIAMQERESFTILDVVMVELQSRGIQPFTIHDSFVVTPNEIDVVRQVFIEKLTELYGIIPQLHQDELFDLEADELEDDMIDYDDFPIGFFAA